MHAYRKQKMKQEPMLNISKTKKENVEGQDIYLLRTRRKKKRTKKRLYS